MFQPSSENIKVAHILSGSQIWGVENYVFNLLSSKNASVLQPSVICTNAGLIANKFSESGYSVTNIPMQNYFDYRCIGDLSEFFKRTDIDIVHVHLGLDSLLGTIAAKRINKPVVMSVHFDQPNYMKHGLIPRQIWNILQKLKNQGISRFLPITENVAAELVLREAVPKDKVTVIHPGIPTFEIDESLRPTIRSKFGCTDSDIVIIAIGRLEVEKNFDCLLHSIARLTKEKSVKLWIVGDGSQRTILENLIADLKLVKSVQLLGYRSDVKELLGAADIFVLASKAEPFGMSAVEAMIAKLPVVATNGPGLGTIVANQKTGILVPPDDALALAKGLNELIENSSLRLTFAHAGRARALELFNSDVMSEKIIDVYREVISNFK